ncbi:Alcohol acetyltransferase [Fusarium falciforme]|nr:Alcohol acetyltransferase [Fusarium falciforme]
MLSRYLDVAHSKPWSLNKPAWTVIILYHDRRLARAALGPARSRIDIAFVAHHALSDGLSGVVFHQSLVQNLAHELKLDRPATWPLELTENVPPPKALEDLIKMDPSVAGTEDHDRQPIWAGRPTSLQAGDGEDGIRSRTRLITVYPQYLHKALQTCKREQITLTGLLHGLICVILSRQLAEAPGFRAITPYSIRRFTKASKDEIVNHIFYMSTPVTRPRLEAIRATVPLSPVERQLIFSVARTFNQAITKELNRFPHDSPIASIGRLGDILAHCRAQVGQAREDTYELSNLGVAENPSRVIINSPLVLEKLFMTQSAMVAGPALGINCVSIRDGAMTLSITWQHGIVEEWLVERLAQELENL